MKLNTVILFVLLLAGLAFTITAFIQNTSPYVKVEQLSQRAGNVHVVLKPLKETIQFNVKTMTLTFEGEDETGKLKVVYPKGKPNNFEMASQVVVIGNYRDGVFHAEDMLIKCPSKYQGTETVQGR